MDHPDLLPYFLIKIPADFRYLIPNELLLMKRWGWKIFLLLTICCYGRNARAQTCVDDYFTIEYQTSTVQNPVSVTLAASLVGADYKDLPADDYMDTLVVTINP